MGKVIEDRLLPHLLGMQAIPEELKLARELDVCLVAGVRCDRFRGVDTSI